MNERQMLSVRLLCWVASLLLASPVFAASSPTSLRIEELTWTELSDRIAAGSTTVLVPIGGTEQNGPHMVLGKHNVRVNALALQIAKTLGNAVVAPVLAYVPEGAIEPPVAHMRFTGTISIPESAFEAVLESTARSFKRHGFRDVVFLGDHGDYQKSLDRVAAKLTRDWAGRAGNAGCRVHSLNDYYRASTDGQVQLLLARGFSKAEIGSHAGLADTSLTLAIDSTLVRQDQLARAAQAGRREGVIGDPRRASAALGQAGVDRIVEAAVAAIRERTR